MLSRLRELFGFEAKSGAAIRLTSPEAGWLFGASQTSSGISVTPQTAMTCAPVRAAIAAISETVGQLPFPVYHRGTDGSKERALDHPAYELLNGAAANPWTAPTTLREQITADALLDHGGFAFINRVSGKPVELLRLYPETVSVTIDAASGEPIYRISDTNGARVIARENILHIPSPSRSGRGLVHDARESIALALTLERHAGRLFGRGARPSGVLKFDGKLDPETATRIKASWQAAHSGESSGNTAVLEAGGSFQQLALSSVDAQFLELRQFAVSEIARHWRVPPVFLMDFGRATWGNSSEMGRQFLQFTLMPWLVRWEGEVNLKLFGKAERETYFAEFVTDALVRGDLAARMDAYSKAIASRILSPNEARAMENRPPYAGGEKFENPNTATSPTKAAA